MTRPTEPSLKTKVEDIIAAATHVRDEAGCAAEIIALVRAEVEPELARLRQVEESLGRAVMLKNHGSDEDWTQFAADYTAYAETCPSRPDDPAALRAALETA